MRKIFMLVSLLAFQAVAAPVITLGEKVDLSLLTPVEEILANPENFINQTLTVQGTVTSVCQKRGCWADITAGSKAWLKLKVRDGHLVIPMSAKGRSATATGILMALNLSQQQSILYLEHMAQDAGQAFDRSSVTQGITVYQLQPNAIEIK